jgi:hypothetical protein
MKKDLKIEFFSTIDFLNDIEECRPKKMSSFTPSWWKLADIPQDQRTFRDCPALIHLFKDSYIVPMWCDTEITILEDGYIDAKFSHPDFTWDFHGNNQLLDYTPENIKKNINIILKAVSPWNIITPKGYSVYQSSPFYEFNENFTIMPGIIATDFHHEIHQQVMVHSKSKKFTIKRGDPFAVYMPFKRDDFKITTRTATDKDKDAVFKNKMNIFTKSKRGYLMAFKENDRKK